MGTALPATAVPDSVIPEAPAQQPAEGGEPANEGSDGSSGPESNPNTSGPEGPSSRTSDANGGASSPRAATNPALTFGLEAFDANSNQAPISTITAGHEFTYKANAGCPDPNGCGPATVVITFPDHINFDHSSFNNPAGSEVKFTPGPGGENKPGGTLEISWSELPYGGSVAYIPALVVEKTDTSHNGKVQTAVGVATAGPATFTEEFPLTLRVHGVPGIEKEDGTWSEASLIEASGSQATNETTAVVTANAPSTLTFKSPGSVAVGQQELPVSEAFDLEKITLNQNPGGATITFAIANGQPVVRTLAPGDTEIAAPANAVGYELTLNNLPSATNGVSADHTYTVSAEYLLREKTRTDGDRIIQNGQTERAVRSNVDVTNRVNDPAPGKLATVTKPTSEPISVASKPLDFDSSIVWTTASGDATSVYRSQEESTLTIRASNKGEPGATHYSVGLPRQSTDYFKYQALSEAPSVTFPAGAVRATIQYGYITAKGAPETPGVTQEFQLGEAVPGTAADALAFDRVSGLQIVFYAADGQVIAGGCAAADACAAEVVLKSTLRDKRLDTEADIVPPATGQGSTSVSVIADISGETKVGGKGSEGTAEAKITLVKSQITAHMGKKFGDKNGLDSLVYPLTGETSAGDLWDPTPGATQNFQEHQLQLTLQTKRASGSTEAAGASVLSLKEPQQTPTIANLGSTPFNVIKFTNLNTPGATCTTTGDVNVPANTVVTVLILDSISAPTTITSVPASTIDPSDESVLDRIVGIEATYTPVAPERFFPADVICETAPGTMVKFREHRVSDNKLVSPETIGSSDSPGLLSLNNTAEMSTGPNMPVTTGSDSLFLLDIAKASVFKAFADGAPSYGMEGEHTATSFLLAGVASTSTATGIRMVDGSSAQKQSFDVFELTGLRDAMLGPDQQMEITFKNRGGNAVGPVGTVAADTKLEDGTELTAEEIENYQSGNYLKYRNTKRAITWSQDWSAGEMENVASVQVIITRPGDKALQQYGGGSVTLDAKLRTHFAADGSEIKGTSNGQRPDQPGEYYKNFAVLESRNSTGAWVDRKEGAAEFPIFTATDVYVGGSTTWLATDTPANEVPFLVAGHDTRSIISMRVANQTAIRGSNTDPSLHWKDSNSLAVGVASLTSSVGGTTATDNPFAVNDFKGIEDIVWPVRTGAPAVKAADGKETAEEAKARRVAATITYTLSTGDPVVVPVPVGTPLTTINADKSFWPDVVGVSVSWHEAEKFITTTREVKAGSQAKANDAKLLIRVDLRKKVRTGYSYQFIAGIPDSLGSGANIDGPEPEVENSAQYLATTPAYSAALPGLTTATVGAAEAKSNRVLLTVEDPRQVVTANLNDGQQYRDIRRDNTWTFAVQNTSNVPASALWLTTDARLITPAQWPDKTPAGFTMHEDSVFDSYDVKQARVTLPTGASHALAYAMGEDGKWTPAMQASAGSLTLTLPQTGDGPKEWKDVVAFRVEFVENQLLDTRIAKQATGSLVLTTVLRETLRSDATELAPETDFPENFAPGTPASELHWTTRTTVSGFAHVGWVDPGREAPRVPAERWVYPGQPQPSVSKFAGAYKHNGENQTTTNGYPGLWANFYVVIRNTSSATSNLYNLSAADTFPTTLAYNAANANSTWSVVRKIDVPGTSQSITVTPDRIPDPTMTYTPSSNKTDANRMDFTFDKDAFLKPNETIVLKVPLQIQDGLPDGGTATNRVQGVGTGIKHAPNPSVCAAADSGDGKCFSTASVTTKATSSMRTESYLDASLLGAETVAGAACDPSSKADWPGTWVRNPCVANTTTGAPLTYRLKLINSGNTPLSELRFVDRFPAIDDLGAVLDAPRNSEWTPSLVPGSVRLLTDDDALATGARGAGTFDDDGVQLETDDVELSGLRYTEHANPCTLIPDGNSGGNTLACTSGNAVWSANGSAKSSAFGGEVRFPAQSPLKGGEFVIVEFQLIAPQQLDAFSHLASRME